jgi:hypothetical protein
MLVRTDLNFWVVVGHRFKTTYDFGFVALDILYAYAEDSGTYMCRAKNAVGEAVTTCSVKVEGKPGGVVCNKVKQCHVVFNKVL